MGAWSIVRSLIALNDLANSRGGANWIRLDTVDIKRTIIGCPTKMLMRLHKISNLDRFIGLFLFSRGKGDSSWASSTQMITLMGCLSMVLIAFWRVDNKARKASMASRDSWWSFSSSSVLGGVCDEGSWVKCWYHWYTTETIRTHLCRLLGPLARSFLRGHQRMWRRRLNETLISLRGATIPTHRWKFI